MFVLFYGNNQHFLDATARTLQAPDISTLAVTSDRREFDRLVSLCDILALDYRLNPAMSRVVRGLAPHVAPRKIVLLAVPDDPASILGCLEAGAYAYLRPSDRPEAARTVLREAHAGHIRFDRPIARWLLEYYEAQRRRKRERAEPRSSHNPEEASSRG